MILTKFMDIEKSINQFLEGKDKTMEENLMKGMPPLIIAITISIHSTNKIKYPNSQIEENLQLSCLHLGFYLACWGMLRGSSFLLEKSVRSYKNLIITISKMDPKLWEIDIDNYNKENIKLLLKCKQQIMDSFGEENKPTDTLITKIMLGVFANVPAFDQYVKNSLKIYDLNEKSLLKLKTFYDENKSIIDSFKIFTFDFLTSDETDIIYTKAKLVDMCGFMEGQNKNLIE